MKRVDLDGRTLRRLVQVDAARTRAAAERMAASLGRPSAYSETPFGTALALRDPDNPTHGFLNRVVGFTAADLPALDPLDAHYTAVGAALQLDLTPDATTPELLRALESHGLRWQGGLVMFRGQPELADFEAPPPSMTMARVDDTLTAEHALDVRAASRPEVWTDRGNRDRWRERVLSDRSHVEYVLYLDGAPVAITALLLLGDACHLSNSQTVERARGRGCQRILLGWSLADAARAGCRLAVTDTFFGTSSHRNAERVGFQMAYTTWWMARDGAASANA